MKISVSNFRGIKSANIEVKQVAFVTGINGAGKSSIAQAVAAVITGNPSPIAGFRKNEAKSLVNDGETKGSATVDGLKITFPTGSCSGKGPAATPLAVGMEHPLDMRPVDAAKFMAEILKTEPTKDDLTDELEGIPKATIEAIWKVIEQSGWDAAAKRAKETGIKNKGRWEMITGLNYGAKIAENWLPPEFSGGVPEVKSLKSKLTKAENAHAKLLANRATGEYEIKRLEDLAATVESLTAHHETLANTDADLLKKLTAAEEKEGDYLAALRALPEPGQEEVTAECPECGTHLVVVSNTQLNHATGGPDEKENKKRAQAIASAKKDLHAAEEKSQAIYNERCARGEELQRVKYQLKEATDAKEQLAKVNRAGATDDDIEAASAKIDEAKYHLSLLDNIEAAHETQEAIKQSARIAGTLAPDGLRKKALTASLGDFNKRLGRLVAAAEYPSVTVTDALTFDYKGRDYRLLSESEAYRVRVALQIAIAQIDGSKLLVIDRADILDNFGRRGLLKMVAKSKIKALICMTISDKGDAPKLPGNFGNTYWVENGEAHGV